MISLVTSLWNGYDRFLSQWLDAVFESEVLPDEIIIGVFGDGFDQQNILRAEERLTWRVPFRIMYSDFRGMGQARNKVVRAASGEWVMHLNIDDLIMPNAIRDIQSCISDQCDIVVGDMEWVGHPRKSGVRNYDLTLDDFFAGKTNDHAAYRKSLWQQSPYIEYSGDVDVAFWIGLAHLGARIKYTDSVLTRHFFRPDTVFGKYNKEDLCEVRRMIAVWKDEGVHSERFREQQYAITGSDHFEHRTIVPTFSIILAYRPDGGIRDRHLKWTINHYKAMFPDAEIIVEKDESGTGWDTFDKSACINRGVRRSHGRFLLITDIDIILIKNKILSCFERLNQHSIAFPFNEIVFLDLNLTESVLKTKKSQRFPRVNSAGCKVKSRTGTQPSGIYVISRKDYDLIGGHDERFVGWGSEDSAFIKTVTTMIDKPPLRLSGLAFHLWHPVDPNRALKRDTSEKHPMMLEYFEANGDKAKMSGILKKRGVIR
ncbi:MAG: galactosyltransferase-related protein [Candidatus Izemoplasmatales bacterium]|nr:galactosyltransferase-related protein [Candidatus Izemoplasmatales bacterium]